MDETRPHPDPADVSAGPEPRSKKWIAPAIYLFAVVVPVLLLIFSNLDSTEIRFAWMEGSAPLFLILAITFAAGAVVTRLLGWVWKTMRRRRKTAA